MRQKHSARSDRWASLFFEGIGKSKAEVHGSFKGGMFLLASSSDSGGLVLLGTSFVIFEDFSGMGS